MVLRPQDTEQQEWRPRRDIRALRSRARPQGGTCWHKDTETSLCPPVLPDVLSKTVSEYNGVGTVGRGGVGTPHLPPPLTYMAEGGRGKDRNFTSSPFLWESLDPARCQRGNPGLERAQILSILNQGKCAQCPWKSTKGKREICKATAKAMMLVNISGAWV